HEAADDVDRAEGDRDHADHVLEAVVGEPDHDQAAEHHDPVDRVRLRHQRRVQGRRHLRDHLEADEGGQHEDRDLGDQVHQALAPPASRARSLTISPSWVMPAPATISSSKSSFSFPSSSTSRPSSLSTLFAYSCEAWVAISLGRLSGAITLTPLSTTVSPASLSSQLPPASPARSTITQPGDIPR